MSDRWVPGRGVRRRCRDALDGLGLPAQGVDIQTVRRCLEASRGRAIVLTPVSEARETHGLWMSTDDAEYVQYETHTTTWHQWLIVCHEFAHMLLEHSADRVISEDTSGLLFPDVPLSAVNFVLRRQIYDSQDEQDAEYLGTLLMQRIDRVSVLPAELDGPEALAVTRLMQSLGDVG